MSQNIFQKSDETAWLGYQQVGVHIHRGVPRG